MATNYYYRNKNKDKLIVSLFIRLTLVFRRPVVSVFCTRYFVKLHQATNYFNVLEKNVMTGGN